MYFHWLMRRLTRNLLSHFTSISMTEAKEEFLSAYDKYAAPILRHIYFRIGDKKTAEDLTQDTFFKTWQYIVSGSEIQYLKTFLYKVANNLIIDFYRAKPRQAVSLENISQKDLAADPELEAKTQTALSMDVIEENLKELKDDYRSILIYRYIDDLSIGEISKITKRTPDNVSVMIHRAIKMLKGKLRDS